jgi:hypothetical protein
MTQRSKVKITVNKPLFPIGSRRAAAQAMAREWVKIIRQRTAKGQFGKGSSGSRAKRYNTEYARKKGVPISPVTLRGNRATRRQDYPGISLLDDMQGGYQFRGDEIQIGIRFNTARNSRVFEYTQNPVPSGKRTPPRRVFVFANKVEMLQIMTAGTKALYRAGRKK